MTTSSRAHSVRRRFEHGATIRFAAIANNVSLRVNVGSGVVDGPR